ncbi:MAG: tetratricopeptide repeat protein [Myxococcota bacterium]
MMHGVFSRLVAAALVGCVAPTVVWAQEEASADEEARALFEQASAAMDEGRYREARELFERSMELLPAPATAFNLSLTYERLGEIRRALAVAQRLRSGELGELGSSERHTLEELNARLHSLLGSLVVRAQGPPQTEVLVDDTDAGVIPNGGEIVFRLDPGRHDIRAQAEGYDSIDEQVFLEPGARQELALRLSPVVAPTPSDSEPPTREARPDPEQPADSESSGVWWPWAIGLSVVAAAAVGVVIALFAVPSDESPTCVSQPGFGCGIETLRSP